MNGENKIMNASDDIENAFLDAGLLKTDTNNELKIEDLPEQNLWYDEKSDNKDSVDISIDNWLSNDGIDLDDDFFKNSEPGSGSDWASDYTQMEDSAPLKEENIIENEVLSDDVSDFGIDASVSEGVETDDVDEVNVENVVSEDDAAIVRNDEIYEIEHGFVKWYSGDVHQDMFKISKADLPENIVGDERRNIIHINIGYDSYGWLVEFADDIVMSLEDVRKYQIKKGQLPSTAGVIRYGKNKCVFSNISRILIYKNVRYFSYGM